MNREEIKYQVSLTLGDHAGDYDMDAIVEDLVAANGNALSVDDFGTEAYLAIVETHDLTLHPRGE